MRLFSALVSVAEPGSEDDEVLRQLELAPPPSIHASPAVRARRDAFVPTNAVLNDTKHTNLPGRTNGERTWARAIPRSREIWYRWNDLALDAHHLEGLRTLCRKVPYLGRSTSPAIIEVSAERGPVDGWLDPIEDAAPGDRIALADTVRCPFPGALNALREAYDERFRQGGTGNPWEVGRGVDYGSVTVDTDHEACGPYSTVVVLRLLSRRLDGRHSARVTHALRRALLARAQEHIAPLHGHHGGEVTQVALLGLLDVGHERARGHVLGVGIALPQLTGSEMKVIADALPSVRETIEVTCGPLGVVKLERVAPLDASVSRGLRVGRWTGPARRWASVTPVVFDRFPGGKGDLIAEVCRAAEHARLPAPLRVAVSRDPFVAGAPRFTPADTLRRAGDKVIPYRHVVVEFSEPVRGPVVLGSMRHYGLGLCIPYPEHDHVAE